MLSKNPLKQLDPLITPKMMGRLPSVLRREGRWLGKGFQLEFYCGKVRESGSVAQWNLFLPTSSTSPPLPPAVEL